ncbi:MAG: hypothetical protein ACFFAH_07695 [Promethearchaeota archaeon]
MSEIFKTNRDKLIRFLLNKISYLDMLFYECNSLEHREKIKLALKNLENLLKTQGYINQTISDKDYESMKRFVDFTISTVF